MRRRLSSTTFPVTHSASEHLIQDEAVKRSYEARFGVACCSQEWFHKRCQQWLAQLSVEAVLHPPSGNKNCPVPMVGRQLCIVGLDKPCSWLIRHALVISVRILSVGEMLPGLCVQHGSEALPTCCRWSVLIACDIAALSLLIGCRNLRSQNLSPSCTSGSSGGAFCISQQDWADSAVEAPLPVSAMPDDAV